MIEKIADDLIGQMTEARLIDKEMEARYVYVFICWIEKFITVGSIIVISLMFHKLLPTIFFLVFFCFLVSSFLVCLFFCFVFKKDF